jgi:hypothetical protein
MQEIPAVIHNTAQGQERHGRRRLPYLRQKFRCWAVMRLTLIMEFLTPTLCV